MIKPATRWRDQSRESANHFGFRTMENINFPEYEK